MERRARKRTVAAILMVVAGLAVAVLALLQVLRAGRHSVDEGIPVERRERSVLLITVDTTRADRLSPYGAEDVETPALQRLATEGITLEQVQSVAPITLPAHTSILTGLYPVQHGVRNNGTHQVSGELTTLAERLGQEGYRTAAFVSAAVLEKRFGLDQGFELYDDNLAAGRARYPRMVPDRPAEATIASASAWLDRIGERERYFCWVHLYDPHAAYNPPAPFRDRYRERLYDGEIAYMDAQIGVLLEHPRVRQERDTVIMVIGDHGESLGAHGEQTHAILAYGATLDVPWIMKLGGAPAGLRVRHPVSQVDVVPTLLDLLGLGSDHRLPGVSVFTGGQAHPERRMLYAESYLPFYTYGWAKLRVMRQGRWRFIDAPGPELYDLTRDPAELSNQFESRRETVAHDLKTALDELLESAGEGGERESELEVNHELREQLRALGYLAGGSGGGDDVPDQERPDPKEVIHVHVALERARRFLNDRLFENAELELTRVLEEDPGNLSALVDLAGAIRAQQRTEDAIAVVERALALDPDFQRLHILMAALEDDRGNTDSALEMIESALRLDASNPEVHIQKALHFQRREQTDAVKAALEVGLERAPDHPRLNAVYAGLIDLPRGDLEQAERRLRAALDRDPFLAVAWRFLGDLEMRQGRRSAAEESYAEGLRRTPDDEALAARLALLLAPSGAEQVGPLLLHAIRLQTSFHSELHVAYGAWLAERGRLEEAQEEYARVLALEPKHPGARNNQAVALVHSGREEEAVEVLEALLQDYPRQVDAHNNLATIAALRSDWSSVEKHARRTLELDDGHAEAWNNLGLALASGGRLEEALESYDQAVSKNARFWAAHANRGDSLAELGRFEQAREAYEAALRLNPRSGQAHLGLGRLFARDLEDPDKARRHLQAFLRLEPGGPEAEEATRLLSDLLLEMANQ